MEAINYLTDAKGRKKAVVIDLEELKIARQSNENALDELLVEVKAIIDFELLKKESAITWTQS